MNYLNPHDAMRLRRGAEHLHLCGARTTAEFLAELAGRIGGMPAILALLTEYEMRLNSTLLRAAGGDRFPPRPLHVVPR